MRREEKWRKPPFIARVRVNEGSGSHLRSQNSVWRLLEVSSELRRRVTGIWKFLKFGETSKGEYGCVEGDLRSVIVSTKSNSDVG
ncbi:unnamed protein product [Linum tenue]|uniref:Uncharacterized protein n=1 Tax=Linum tenue TaxID=586396 RepID=A0AAV0R1K0_9ROSI|nr:unnamed protein product [Linum tenue]